MAQEKTFDGEEYFKEMARHNRLCQEHGFMIGACTGPESLQTVIAEFRDRGYFVLVDDTNDGSMMSNGVGRFMRRVYTVFILAQYDWDNLDERRERLELCRRIYRQFVSRVLKDRRQRVENEGLPFLNLDTMYYRELGRYAMNGVTGLYFMLENDEATDLRYVKDEWDGDWEP